jgi:hypothetical protein
MASADEEGRTPNYYRPLMMRLKYRLHLELHRSIMDNDTDRFQNYWLYRQVLGRMEGERLMVEGLVWCSYVYTLDGCVCVCAMYK